MIIDNPDSLDSVSKFSGFYVHFYTKEDITVHPPSLSCPLYKTSARRGTVDSSGESKNFILSVNLRIKSQALLDNWIRRGVVLYADI